VIIDIVPGYAGADANIEEYRPDAEKIISGDPAQWLRTDYITETGNGTFDGGEWRSQPGKYKVSFSGPEYCEILEGESIVTDLEGNAKTVRAGDRFIVPAGFEGTWEVTIPCRKIFICFTL
tara:strand:+ start:131 stop:493 length:363 start_codon:yes stop_codon:yes gene_type:complete